MASGQERALKEVPGLGQMDYEGLKRNVQHLKQEHKKAKELCETSKKLETLTLVQQREDFERREEEYILKIDKLQNSLREHTERSTKTRTQYEREKKAQQAKTEKSAVRLQEAADRERAELDRLRQEKDAELEEVYLRLGRAEEEHASEKQQWQTERLNLEQQAAGWCQSEISRARQEHQQQIQELEEASELQQQRYDEREAELHDLLQTYNACQSLNSELEAQVLGGEAEASRLASQVQQLQLEAVMLKRDLDSERQARKQETSHLRTQCELQVCEYREKKLGEMEALHRRFQEIVRKKDESIASLKESLAAAQLQLRGHAELLEQQRVELLG